LETLTGVGAGQSVGPGHPEGYPGPVGLLRPYAGRLDMALANVASTSPPAPHGDLPAPPGSGGAFQPATCGGDATRDAPSAGVSLHMLSHSLATGRCSANMWRASSSFSRPCSVKSRLLACLRRADRLEAFLCKIPSCTNSRLGSGVYVQGRRSLLRARIGGFHGTGSWPLHSALQTLI
jgi:hypothetical protein